MQGFIDFSTNPPYNYLRINLLILIKNDTETAIGSGQAIMPVSNYSSFFSSGLIYKLPLAIYTLSANLTSTGFAYANP